LVNDKFGSLNEILHNHTIGNGALQQLLRYADRNSMAFSREIRLPFLNHQIVDFLFSLPDEMKINLGWSKWIMRESFSAELPAEICWRKDKIGFEPPQSAWLQNNEVQEVIFNATEQLADLNILDKKKIKQKNNSKHLGSHSWRHLQAACLFTKVV